MTVIRAFQVWPVKKKFNTIDNRRRAGDFFTYRDYEANSNHPVETRKGKNEWVTTVQPRLDSQLLEDSGNKTPLKYSPRDTWQF